jgi:hypothetical protein
MSKKQKTILENAEFGVDSKYISRKAKKEDGRSLMEARLKRMKNLSPADITKAKLIQLKLRMEEYIKQPVYDNYNFFTSFLTNYIDTLYNKRSNFANDIDITPVRLSQVLNNHRAPSEEFLLRLMIHSEKIFKKICPFPKMTWHQVYFHEKICDTIANQDQWRPKVEKHVKIRS